MEWEHVVWRSWRSQGLHATCGGARARLQAHAAAMLRPGVTRAAAPAAPCCAVQGRPAAVRPDQEPADIRGPGSAAQAQGGWVGGVSSAERVPGWDRW